jgi:hypothetical protein
MSFSMFLSRSLTILELESPGAYRAVVEVLGNRSVNVQVDGELVGLLTVRQRIVTAPPLDAPTTVAITSRKALCRLLRGEQDLTQAILNDEVSLFGSLEDLTTLYDALVCYFRGAVRSPGFPPLLDEFLGLHLRTPTPRFLTP